MEKAVDYVKRNFLAGLELTSLDALDATAKLWLCSVANVRQHASTDRRPDDLFAEEKALLRPLPASLRRRHPPRRVRQPLVPRHLQRRPPRATAAYAGARLTLKAYPDAWSFRRERLVAEHPRPAAAPPGLRASRSPPAPARKPLPCPPAACPPALPPARPHRRGSTTNCANAAPTSTTTSPASSP